MKPLYPYQITGKDFLVDKRRCLLADDMGLGKTLTAIAAARELMTTNVLVVCPLSVRHTWCKVIREQYPEAPVHELKRRTDTPMANCFNVINYDLCWRSGMCTKLKEHNWRVIILDEAHYLKGIESKRTKYILGRDSLCSRSKNVWALTGTPILNRPVEIYPLIRSLNPELLKDYKDYYAFGKKFCGGYHDNYGFNVSGATNLSELAELVKPFMLRRTKQEVLSCLPEIIYDKVYVEPSDKLLKICREERTLIGNRQVTDIVEGGEIADLRRMLGVIKAQTAKDHVADLLETTGKVVAYTYHKDVAAIMGQIPGAVLYTGEQTVEQKKAAVQRFRTEPECRVFVGQINAAGTGIDGLQDVCDCCVFVEMSYVPGQIEQGIGRLHRIGQKNSVLVQFIIVEGSIDEMVVDSISRKEKNIQKIMQDGKEGILVRCGLCGKLIPIGRMEKECCPACQRALSALGDII